MEKSLYSLIILKYFAEHSDAEHPVTPGDIQAHFQATRHVKPCRNTIRSAIEKLNSEGFEIIRIKGKRARYYLANRSLSNGEIVMLCDMIHSTFSISSDESKRLIKKLLEMLPNKLRENYKDMIHLDNTKKDPIGTDFFETYFLIKRACSQHTAISIKYRTNPKLVHNEIVYQERTHILYPCAVTTNSSLPYLIANKKGKTGFSNYRIDRIMSIHFLSEPFPSDILKESFDHYQTFTSPYMYSGEKIHASFICEMPILNAITDRIGHNARLYQIEDDPDRFYLQFDAPRNDVKLFALQYSDGVTLTHPEDLKDEVIRGLRKTLSRYKSV